MFQISMKRIFQLIFIIASVLVHFNDGIANLRIRIKNYRNPENLMHNGAKCETYHWAGDHCDPMFDICVTSSYHSCNIVKTFINFKANKKYIYDIWEETMRLYSFHDRIYVRVQVTDHDRFDAHDHIAHFIGEFHITQLGFNYIQYMEVNPMGLNVHLAAEAMIKCHKDYYGPKCENHCIPNPHLYECDKNTGEKICIRNCGHHGQCVFYSSFQRKISKCKCSIGWVGLRCQIKVIAILLHTTLETYVPSTSIGFSTSTLASVPSTSMGFSTSTLTSTYSPSTILTSTYSPTALKNTTYVESKSSNITNTSDDIENTPQLTTLGFNSKNNNDKDTISALIARLNQKENENKSGLLNYSKINASQILIIIAVLMAICILFLFGHQYLKLKYKNKYLNQSLVQRSLPPVVFKSNQNNQDCTLYTMADSDYDTCSIKTISNDSPENIKFHNNTIEEDDNLYEKPICKNRQM